MEYSRKISERQWNLPDKGELESKREETFIDDIIQKNHIQRKILKKLDGIKNVFDGGAGCGVKNIRLSGPVAYGRTIPRELLVKIMNDPEEKKEFLDFCYRFDSNPYVCGMGKDNLLAVGEL